MESKEHLAGSKGRLVSEIDDVRLSIDVFDGLLATLPDYTFTRMTTLEKGALRVWLGKRCKYAPVVFSVGFVEALPVPDGRLRLYIYGMESDAPDYCGPRVSVGYRDDEGKLVTTPSEPSDPWAWGMARRITEAVRGVGGLPAERKAERQPALKTRERAASVKYDGGGFAMERKRRYVNTDIGTVENRLRQYICEKETRRWSGDTNGPGGARLIVADGHLWVCHSDPDGEFNLQLQKRNPGEGWQPLTHPVTLTAHRTEAQRVQVTLDCEEEGAKEATALWAEMQSLWPEVRKQLAASGIVAGGGTSDEGQGQPSHMQAGAGREVHPDIRKRREDARHLRSQGYTIREIAWQLGVSNSTIKRDLKKG